MQLSKYCVNISSLKHNCYYYNQKNNSLKLTVYTLNKSDTVY